MPPKPRLRSGSVNVPAVVSQVCCTRLSISIESACCPKPPAAPPAPGSSLSDPESRPMLMLWKVAWLPVWPDASTMRLSALTGVPPPPAVRCRVTGPIVTLWHRLVSVAEWMAEMMTGWLPEAPEICPPYCSNPVPVELARRDQVLLAGDGDARGDGPFGGQPDEQARDDWRPAPPRSRTGATGPARGPMSCCCCCDQPTCRSQSEDAVRTPEVRARAGVSNRTPGAARKVTPR